jgi:hypothetical protein
LFCRSHCLASRHRVALACSQKLYRRESAGQEYQAIKIDLFILGAGLISLKSQISNLKFNPAQPQVKSANYIFFCVLPVWLTDRQDDLLKCGSLFTELLWSTV